MGSYGDANVMMLMLVCSIHVLQSGGVDSDHASTVNPFPTNNECIC